jgi:hypothetical protein
MQCSHSSNPDPLTLRRASRKFARASGTAAGARLGPSGRPAGLIERPAVATAARAGR